MRVLFSTARNIRYSLVEDAIEPEIEAVLAVYGRHTEFVGAGVSQVEHCETVRFTMTLDAARKFSERLLEWADEAEKQATRLTLKKGRAMQKRLDLHDWPLVVQSSWVEDESQEANCQHCGSPICIGEKRWIEIGDEGAFGTFAVGCSAECCFEAAITELHWIKEVKEVQSD